MSRSQPSVPDHLNSTGCRIGYSEGKGRGVFATRKIPAQTVIEISPVLLFSKEEYEQHGKQTLLDCYTFNWRDGRMALALGLGSLFNHADPPNVSFVRDVSTESIRYITSRTILPDEELCIFYGHHLWFTDASGSLTNPNLMVPKDGLEWLKYIGSDVGENPFLEGDVDAIIVDEQLPFIRTNVMPDAEEEETETSIRTMSVWVVDIFDPRAIGTLLTWIKHAGLETPELAHLKRIRRTAHGSMLLLSSSPDPPDIPVEFALPAPVLLSVPASVALTPTSMRLKGNLWPTVYAPRRKGEPERWSRARAAWAWDAVQVLISEAHRLKEGGELPIVSYVPTPYINDSDINSEGMPLLIATDLRRSHPLRHSVLNVIRQVADWRASSTSVSAATQNSSISASASTSVSTPPIMTPEDQPLLSNADSYIPAAPRNGNHYLLTSLTLFTTHEPCIMCSMALLHSRVKEVIYLRPMDQTGGCGGSSGKGTCVPRLKGVNHRFTITRWKQDEEANESEDLLRITEDIDA